MTPDAETLDEVWPSNINEVPKSIFVDAKLFERELELIFQGPEWTPVAHEAEIAAAGDFKTFDLGRVPLLITRGQDSKIRAFINSCTHRGTQVETSSCGNRKHFECPYHRWMFSTEGDLMACPASNDYSPGFDKKNYGLREVRSELFHGLLFVTMDESAPELISYLGRAAQTIADQLGEGGSLKFVGDQKVRYATNWKAYGDNDGFHPPLLHTGFRLLQWQGGAGQQYITPNGHVAVESQLKPPSNAGVLKDPSLIEFKGENPETGSRLVQLFPVTIIAKHLDVISVRFAIPRAVDCTEVHYAYFVRHEDDKDMASHRVRQASNLLGPCGMISMEDAAVFQRIHVGSHSPGSAVFQKGVTQTETLDFPYKQNDETGGLPRWEYYRTVMGFRREKA
jgi:anthranilate 1,2-dioxygenase large subunit